MSQFSNVYKTIFSLLSEDDTINPLVPNSNIRPFDDQSTPAQGGLICYIFDNTSWDSKADRGSGKLLVGVEHPSSLLIVESIVEKIRELFQEDLLTGNGTTVSLIVETESPEVATRLGKFSMSLSFEIKLF